MKENFQIIEHYLKKLNRPTANRLNPGIDSSKYEEKFKELGITVPDELLELYRWRNGTTIRLGEQIEDFHFFPGFYFVPLEEALQKLENFRSDERWRSFWLPVFANDGGDFYVVECIDKPIEKSFQVVCFLLGEEVHDVEYSSIQSMIGTIARCYVEGAYYVDETEALEGILKEEARIAHEVDPNVSYWKTVAQDLRDRP